MAGTAFAGGTITDPGATHTSEARDGKLERYQQVLLVLLGLFGCLVVWGGMTQFVDALRLRFVGLETMGVVSRGPRTHRAHRCQGPGVVPGRPAEGRLRSEVGLSWVHLLTVTVGFGLVAAPPAVLLLTGTWRLPGRWFVALRRRTR